MPFLHLPLGLYNFKIATAFVVCNFPWLAQSFAFLVIITMNSDAIVVFTVVIIKALFVTKADLIVPIADHVIALKEQAVKATRVV